MFRYAVNELPQPIKKKERKMYNMIVKVVVEKLAETAAERFAEAVVELLIAWIRRLDEFGLGHKQYARCISWIVDWIRHSLIRTVLILWKLSSVIPLYKSC
uniref:MOR2-PAG1_N domain-containing protein n=1 Tax=Bursaphelenchus xylophilus TaxID=6326 RepID=A0A1I7SPV9_BURXY